jgi:hypothetical protein
MRAENDSPTYMLRTLTRKHVHPPVNTAWGDVPTADQNLAFINSRAMIGANRFDNTRTEMPIMPQRTDDTEQSTVDRSLTPITRAKKAEKDN